MRSLENRTGFLFGLLILLFASALFFLFDLGQPALLDYDEAIYAQVIADTGVSANFPVLMYGGEPFFDKPPLAYWLAMLSERLWGAGEFALRFPAAIFGILGILATVLLTLELTGRKSVALLGGVVLLTTGAFLEAGRQLRLDVPVTTCIVFAYYAFLRGRKDTRWYLLVGVFVALGILFKSIIGFFALIPILAYSIVERDFSWLRQRDTWFGVLLSILIILPWHLHETLHFGSAFWQSYLFHHVFERFESAILGGASSNWEYVKYSLLYTFPWILTFLIGCLGLFSRKNRAGETGKTLLVLAFTVITIYVLFGIARTKLFYYLVPTMPFVAVFSTLYLERTRNRMGTYGNALIVILLLAGLVSAPYVGFNKEFHLARNQAVAEEERRIGLVLKNAGTPSEIKAFDYDYWDTIRYYSGGTHVTSLKEGTVGTEPFLLVMSSALYATSPFSKKTMEHLTPLYKGDLLVLLSFAP